MMNDVPKEYFQNNIFIWHHLNRVLHLVET